MKDVILHSMPCGIDLTARRLDETEWEISFTYGAEDDRAYLLSVDITPAQVRSLRQLINKLARNTPK